jgi:hypothetical protein
MNAHFNAHYWLRRPRFCFSSQNSDRRSLKHFAHLGQKANLDGENQFLFSERLQAFNGLLVAALIAMLFWVPLIFGILRHFRLK